MVAVLDISPEDPAARIEIAQRLIAIRNEKGISQEGLCRLRGVPRHHQNNIERGTNWHVETLQAWSRSLGYTLVMTTRGLPELDDEDDIYAMILAMAKPKDRQAHDLLHRISVRNYLIRLRIHMGITITELASRWGRGVDSVSSWELAREDTSLLHTLQRYARSLGGWLHLDLGDYPEGLPE